ncbi:glycosyltransferase [Sulfuricurvum sp. MLSB]|uniref:glycosyltransferase n=1 Tax=Sulfuricurvum sp. MLSB TaxID=1537917 RepID=UPI000ACB05E5|nr:glycosyltransferase [Sulfuricurvum sp. MLSB]
MKIMISAFGSHGDVLPLISLAQEFASRDCNVIFYANPFFESKIKDSSIHFVAVGTQEEYVALFSQTNEGDAVKSFKNIARELQKLMPDYYALMRKDVLDSNTIMIHNSLLFAARLVSETQKIPCVTIHLAPSVFRSNYNPARIVPKWIDATTPIFIKYLAWWTIDTLFYDPFFTLPLNNFRKKLGLPKVKRIFKSWIHEADLVVGLFPSWFAPPQNDWPKNIFLSGFPLFDQIDKKELSKEIMEFIKSDLPTVVFSAGTASARENEFFRICVEVCQLLSIQGILLSPFSEHIPNDLPQNVLYVAYVPFSLLLPHVDIFVHHGGIGSTSQALKAGVPQIIRPVAYDQFDNSDRAVKLGVAKEILPNNYTTSNVQLAITELLEDYVMKRTCQDMRSKLQENDAIKAACDAIIRKIFHLRKS